MPERAASKAKPTDRPVVPPRHGIERQEARAADICTAAGSTRELPLPVGALAPAQHALARVGWEIENLDVDRVAGTVRIDLKRYDGRITTLFADRFGRAYVERLQRTEHRLTGRPEWQAPGLDFRFLGRDRYATPQDALRALCEYALANPAVGFAALPRSDARAALATITETMSGFQLDVRLEPL